MQPRPAQSADKLSSCTEQLAETSGTVTGAGELPPLGTTCSCAEGWGSPSSQDALLQPKRRPLYLYIHCCLQFLKGETVQEMIWAISTEGKGERGEPGTGSSPPRLHWHGWQSCLVAGVPRISQGGQDGGKPLGRDPLARTVLLQGWGAAEQPPPHQHKPAFGYRCTRYECSEAS